jgi:DNA topoisomerase IA
VFGRSGGDNDNAHAPIYPLEVKTTFQGGVYEEAIYEFIVTNFLASVAQDAEI